MPADGASWSPALWCLWCNRLLLLLLGHRFASAPSSSSPPYTPRPLLLGPATFALITYSTFISFLPYFYLFGKTDYCDLLQLTLVWRLEDISFFLKKPGKNILFAKLKSCPKYFAIFFCSVFFSSSVFMVKISLLLLLQLLRSPTTAPLAFDWLSPFGCRFFAKFPPALPFPAVHCSTKLMVIIMLWSSFA